MEEKVENPDDSQVVSGEKRVQNGLAEIIGMTMEPNSNQDSLRTPESTWQKVLAKFLAVEFSMVPIAIFLIYLFDLPNSGDLAGQLLGQDSWMLVPSMECYRRSHYLLYLSLVNFVDLTGGHFAIFVSW